MGNDFSYQDLTSCSSASHAPGSRVSFPYTPANLTGSAPSLKTPPTKPRVMMKLGRPPSASAAASRSAAKQLSSSSAAVSPAVASSAPGSTTKLVNGRPSSARQATAATAAAAGAANNTDVNGRQRDDGVELSSASELSESDNEAAFNRSTTSQEREFRHRTLTSASDTLAVGRAANSRGVPEVASACQCACHSGRGDVMESLRSELRAAKQELERQREQLAAMRQTEAKLRQRLSEQARRQLEKTSTKFEDLSLGDHRPTQLIRRYGNLYTEARVDALDALDDVTEMTEFADLKGKLLLTILVLSFRSARKTLLGVKLQVRHLLHIPEVLGAPPLTSSLHDACAASASASAGGSDTLALDPAVRELDDVISVYLRKTVDRFDLSRNFEEVCQRVWDTLYDFPRLRQCAGLLRYVDECVRLAWALTVQNPSFYIHYEHCRYASDLHTRFHTSDASSELIRAVLWPVLTEGETGPAVYKGVVVT